MKPAPAGNAEPQLGAKTPHAKLGLGTPSLPPGYKQTEVGVIPEEWAIGSLGRICDVRDGTHESPRFHKDGIPFVTSKNIVDGRLDLENVNFISKSDALQFDKRSKVDRNDILLSMIGTIGSAVLVDCEPKFCIKNVALLKARTVAPTFLIQLISSPVFQKYLADNLDGGIQKFISLGKLRQLSIPLPDVTEQRAIATALSDVDGLLGALDRLIAKKRDLKQAAMQQLLTGQTRLPGFKGEWAVKTFGEVFDYLPTATNSRSDLDDGGDTYYIHYGDIHTRFHNHLDFETIQPPRIKRSFCRNAALLKNGDWVMADASEDYDGVGKTIEIQGLGANIAAISGLHTFVLRERTPTFAPGFKGHLGNLKPLHEQYLRVATGMKVYGVSKTALKDLELPVPPLPEQTEIAEVLSEMDAELARLEQRREKTRALKQGMMQELLTGRTRLPGNAEPQLGASMKSK